MAQPLKKCATLISLPFGVPVVINLVEGTVESPECII